ncbi:LysR substrate-binding domain-containing protein [Marinomonas ostreistagni]|uniref:LysR substrate-binding domain-containing protein n=1 Tax=Marinomonas ostreistagni TaxID=359209 RepID=UPI001951EF8F|nr:LysR substrate-binding domain-containing protein [Marinomonas ostreistagni]MBM6552180.1 LysR family transcriptional regulator [Marinomonas ostreistagni]
MIKSALPYLHTFVVAAKWLSFTKAAEELFLTQGAVSQQIRQLEERLGFALFIRHHRRLELTTMGARLALHLRHAFADLDSLIEELRDERDSNIITLSVMPSFATRWLIPRLGRLKEAFPALQLRIQANEGEVRFSRDRIDAAIIHSHLHSGSSFTHPLLRDHVFPVCSPAFAEQNQLQQPQDLARVPLINDDSEWRFFSPYAEWEAWLALAKVKGARPSRAMSFNRGDLAVQAALSGQGVALGRTPLVMEDIREGRLLKPFSEVYDNGHSYLFSCPREHKDREAIQQLLKWLIHECYEYSPEDAVF